MHADHRPVVLLSVHRSGQCSNFTLVNVQILQGALALWRTNEDWYRVTNVTDRNACVIERAVRYFEHPDDMLAKRCRAIAGKHPDLCDRLNSSTLDSILRSIAVQNVTDQLKMLGIIRHTLECNTLNSDCLAKIMSYISPIDIGFPSFF